MSEERRWFQSEWFLPVAVAAVPLAVSSFRLFAFARGDSEVFNALLGSTNLLTVWITTIFQLVVPLAPLTIPLLYIWRPAWQPGYDLYVRSNGEVTFNQAPRTLYAVVLAVVLGFGLSTWPYAVIGGVSVVASGIFLYFRAMWLQTHLILDRARAELANEEGVQLDDDRGRPRQDRRMSEFNASIQAGSYVGAIGLLLVTFFTPIPVGIPVERIKIEGESGMRSGYVMTVDDLSMTVTKLDGGIEKIPNSKIQGRYVCPNPGSNGIKIALKYIRGDSPLPPVECDGVPDPYLLNRRPIVWPIMAGWTIR